MSRVAELPRQQAKIHYSDVTSRRVFTFMGYTTRDLVAYALPPVDFTYAPYVDSVGGVDRFFDNATIDEKGGGNWEVVVSYVKNPDQETLSYSIGVQSTKMYTSLSTVRTYDCVNGGIDTDATPNFFKSIGINGQNIDGVEVEIGKTTFTINRKLKMSTLSADYLDIVQAMTPSINDDTFDYTFKGQVLSWDSGELKFGGVHFQLTSDDALDITYSFAVSKNLVAGANFTIGSSDAIEKLGWDYMWVFSRPATDAVANILVKQPLGAYIEKVFDYTDFSVLGL